MSCKVYIVFEQVLSKKVGITLHVVGVYSTKKRAKAEIAIAERRGVIAEWRVCPFVVDQDSINEYIEDNNLWEDENGKAKL